MKTILIGLLAFSSISAFAAKIEFTQDLRKCGGTMELRKHLKIGAPKYSLKFKNVVRCSNILLSSGEKLKLERAENTSVAFESQSIRLSDDAATAAQDGRLYVDIESNDKRINDAYQIFIPLND